MFRRAQQRYGKSPEPATPFQKAGQLWDERIGSYRVQARNWRLMAFGVSGLALMLTAGMIWQSSHSRITPFVVEVDRHGEAKAVSEADKSYRPTDAQIAWYLARFIANVRSLSTDSVVVRHSWLEAYDFATDRGATVLNEYAAANNPFERVGNRTISVQVNSVVKASESTYQMKWTEQTFEQNSLISTENWTAMLTVVTQTPRTAATLRKNPLGIYVNGIAWTQDLNTTSNR